MRKIATTKHVVCFHESGPAKALSNFDTREDVAFTFRGHSFRCAEAAYLWARLHHTRNHKLGQLFTCNGERALVLSQELEGLYPKVEDTVLMRQVLVAKFKNPVWRSLLDATKGAYLLSMGSDPLVSWKRWNGTKHAWPHVDGCTQLFFQGWATAGKASSTNYICRKEPVKNSPARCSITD